MAEDGTGGEGGGGEGGGGGNSVPYDRFSKVVAARNDLQARLDQTVAELQTAAEKAATVDSLTRSVDDWRSKAEAAEGRFRSYREISGTLGNTDPDVVELVEFQYGKLAADGRPPLADWLKGLREKPDSAPSTLRPFLQPGEGGKVGDQGGGEGGGEGGKLRPKGTGGRTQAAGATHDVTADQVRAARQHGVKTGDWSRYQAIKKRMSGAA